MNRALEITQYLLVGSALPAASTLWLALRKDKKDAPMDAADLVSRLIGNVDSMSEQLEDALGQLRQSRKDNDAMRSEVASARSEAREAQVTSRQTQRLIVQHVAPLVDWIDRGATPPPPFVSDELRALVDDMRDKP